MAIHQIVVKLFLSGPTNTTVSRAMPLVLLKTSFLKQWWRFVSNRTHKWVRKSIMLFVLWYYCAFAVSSAALKWISMHAQKQAGIGNVSFVMPGKEQKCSNKHWCSRDPFTLSVLSWREALPVISPPLENHNVSYRLKEKSCSLLFHWRINWGLIKWLAPLAPEKLRQLYWVSLEFLSALSAA